MISMASRFSAASPFGAWLTQPSRRRLQSAMNAHLPMDLPMEFVELMSRLSRYVPVRLAVSNARTSTRRSGTSAYSTSDEERSVSLLGEAAL